MGGIIHDCPRVFHALQYRDHELTGEWAGFRELHIGGDFLLVYRVDEKNEIIYFTDLGTHAELFE
ncbi:type II toxin-antitoxin system YafQ family toxin [Salmonella enterica subsp. diarizonae]|nr:type II toxin-antitoxin system YafQ family toxin [Salmonella enterica subsp. diarizonae]